MNSTIQEIIEWAYCIIIAVALALLVRYYIGTPTIVQQPSMYPTLKQDQRLILNRLIRTSHSMPERGDIVTFEAPSKAVIYENEADLSNPVAIYEHEPKGLWEKFSYYVLESNKTSYIKRVIALPGEHIQIYNQKVYINNELLNEPYLQGDNALATLPDGAFYNIVVPEGCIYVMGDNRAKSTDSRKFGCIPISKIESKVLIRFWPLDLFGPVD